MKCAEQPLYPLPAPCGVSVFDLRDDVDAGMLVEGGG